MPSYFDFLVEEIVDVIELPLNHRQPRNDDVENHLLLTNGNNIINISI